MGVWFALWSVLVIGAVAAPVLIGAWLWRLGRALVRESGAIAAALAPQEVPEAVPAPAVPTLLDHGTRERARANLRATRAERAARRANGLTQAVERWSRYGLA